MVICGLAPAAIGFRRFTTFVSLPEKSEVKSGGKIGSVREKSEVKSGQSEISEVKSGQSEISCFYVSSNKIKQKGSL